MNRRSLSFAFVTVLLTGAMAAAQAHAPVVTMNVTTPDGRTHELTAAESGLATLTLKGGTEYGFRPTIQDSSPWNRIVVTIFRSATAGLQRARRALERHEAAPGVNARREPRDCRGALLLIHTNRGLAKSHIAVQRTGACRRPIVS